MKLTETKFIWRDGRMIEWADAQVHVLSHSMQFGSSAFEQSSAFRIISSG
jgi:branched-chain amino acid aminotransferase